MMKILLTFLLTLNIFAQGYDEITDGYEEEELKLRTKITIATIVNISALELVRHGHMKEAAMLRDEWQSQNVRHFTNNLSIYDIGDYTPLNQWLADWYDKIESKIPEKIFNLTRLKDIKILNYGIPVAFDPSNESWDKEEYRKHFVPFSATISYWSFKAGCKISSLQPIPGLICDVAAKGFEKAMYRRIGPNLSDKIYDKAQRQLQ